MKAILVLLTICILPLLGKTQKTDKNLEKELRQMIQGFNGDIGIYVKNLRTGKIVEINADTVFPTASIVKVPILIGVMDKLQKGELNLDSTHVYRDSLLYEGEDILGSFKDGEKIALKHIMMLMLTTSDNTASLWLQKLSGTGTRINRIMDSLGFVSTRINSRTPGREEIRKIYGWGQTSPKEMARLFEMIYRNQLYSPAACEKMQRNLGRNFWDVDEGLSQIPPYIKVYSKNGCVDQTRSEVMLINAPNNPYIFCIFTKNNKDSSWVHNNEAWTLARKVSARLWKYFEPKDKWQASVD